MRHYKINVDMDRKCRLCGKGGATGVGDEPGNVCMECISKQMKGDNGMAITEEVLQEICGDLEKVLIENQEMISAAFRVMSTAGMKLTIGVDMDPKDSGVVLNYSVSWPTSPKPAAQLKETVKLKKTINFNQTEIFD
jgi:hypothetical protein